MLDERIHERAREEVDEFFRLALISSAAAPVSTQRRHIKLWREAIEEQRRAESREVVHVTLGRMIPVSYVALLLQAWVLGVHVHDGEWLRAATVLPVIGVVGLAVHLMTWVRKKL